MSSLTAARRKQRGLEAAINYYPFHIGDYVSATRHLSWEEDAAFRRLLDTYYTTEKPIPLDHRQACRLVMAQTESQREAVRTVLEEFFEQTPDGWVNKRADTEIEAMREKQQKQRDKANKRWGSAKGGNSALPRHEASDATASKSDADAMPPTPTPTPITSSNEEVDSGPAQRSEPPAPPPPFDGNNAEALNGKSIVLLSGGWELPTDWGEDAERLGWKPAEILLQAEKFRQYWTAGKGKGTRRAVKGWRQTWSNWLAKAAENRR